MGYYFNRACACLMVAVLIGGTGCSFFTGLHETIPVRTNVPGARILVDGQPMGTTPQADSPLYVTLRKDKDHYVTATKEGYESSTRSLQRKLSGVGFVDVVGAYFWLLPIVTIGTGHAWTLEPDSLYLTLDPLSKTGTPQQR